MIERAARQTVRPTVRVVGLGPGPVELVTDQTRAVLDGSRHRYVRTRRHPSADLVPDAVSFDDIYERHASFEAVYRDIVETLVEAAVAHGEVVYAVPGSPMVAERTVELLNADDRVQVEIHPALSFLDLAWARLKVDPLATGVRVVDGHRFATEAAGERGPLLVAQCHSPAILSEIKLSIDADGDFEGPPVVVLQRLGSPDESVCTVSWSDLDRAIVPDHLTSLYIASMAAPVASELSALAEVTRTLRERCPWDSAQTHESLSRYVVEEAYEVVEAIDVLQHADAEPAVIDHFLDELGDVLLQVFLHSAIAAEQGWFTLADVAREQREKLIRRHPHVFAVDDGFDASALRTADDVAGIWEQIKARERSPEVAGDPFQKIARSLPALTYAAEVIKAATRAGLPDLPSGDGVGETLLRVVADARSAGIDAEVALRQAAARWRDDIRSRG